MSKYVVLGIGLIIVAVIVGAIMYGTNEPAPAQPTGIELDIDRPKSKPVKPAPAPKVRTRK